MVSKKQIVSIILSLMFCVSINIKAEDEALAPTVACKVTVKRNGKIVPRARVWAYKVNGENKLTLNNVYANDEGIATFNLVEGMKVKYGALVDGINYYSEATITPASVEINFSTEVGEVTVKINNKPASRRKVWVYRVTGTSQTMLTSGYTNGKGLAEFGLAAGIKIKYLVIINGTNYYSEESTTPASAVINVETNVCNVTIKKNGKSLPNANVWAYRVNGSYLTSLGKVIADDNGVARFSLVEGLKVKYLAIEDGEKFYSEETTTPTSSEINITSVKCQVSVKSNGTAISKAGVYAYKVNGQDLLSLKLAYTDDTGIATFDLIKGIKVKYKVIVDTQGYLSEELETPADTEINIPKADCKVAVKIDGKPVANTAVWVCRVSENGVLTIKNGSTSSEGIATFSLVKGLKVKYLLFVNGVKYYSEESITPADAQINASTVKCKVTVKSNGAPLSAVNVYAYRVNGQDLLSLNVSQTDDTGVATFDLAKGVKVKYKAIVDGQGYLSEETTTPADIEINVSKSACKVTVKVDGKIASNATVWVCKVIGSNVADIKIGHTDDSGVATFELPEGIKVKYKTLQNGKVFYSEESTTPANIELNLTGASDESSDG